MVERGKGSLVEEMVVVGCSILEIACHIPMHGTLHGLHGGPSAPCILAHRKFRCLVSSPPCTSTRLVTFSEIHWCRWLPISLAFRVTLPTVLHPNVGLRCNVEYRLSTRSDSFPRSGNTTTAGHSMDLGILRYRVPHAISFFHHWFRILNEDVLNLTRQSEFQLFTTPLGRRGFYGCRDLWRFLSTILQ